MAALIVPARCLLCNTLEPLHVGPPRASIRQDMTGKTYGQLVIQHFVGMVKNKAYWCCLCSCGRPKIIEGYPLRRGITISCGCVGLARRLAARRTHGMSDTLLYRRWQGMMQRCGNPRSRWFYKYGGRGITVCESWQRSFEAFVRDMGIPEPGMSLERVDNDGPYSPENCVWASGTVQARNTRQNHWLTYNGETLTVTDWSKRTGIANTTIRQRIQRGWDIATTLTTPGGRTRWRQYGT